jgi:hypothetical protein
MTFRAVLIVGIVSCSVNVVITHSAVLVYSRSLELDIR